MTPTLLHAVARKAEAIAPDADLLARFAGEQDHPAFEELVRRHGPLVWAVCRHMLPDHADAEDAFQAVFLALVRSATTIRDGRTVPAWLHGVAVRVATRARREFARRRARERVAAVPETDRRVPDAAWESLIAAIHEEVQQLPEAERTAFVLCDLEGVSQADAAARLGWPLGSVSGRLCKARQRLLARLTARGIAPAAALGMGMTASAASAVPAKLFDAVMVFPGAPGAASAVVTALARGLTEGLAMRMKLTAAAVVVAAAFGVTGGAVLLSKAEAQPPGGGFGPPPGMGGTSGPPPGPGTGQPGGGGPGPGGNTWGAAGGPGGGFGAGWAVGPTKWEYKFVAGGFPAKDFVQLFTDMGNDGWEFCGYWEIAANQLADALKAHPDKIVVRPGSLATLIFKRQKGGNFVGGIGGIGGVGGGMPGGGPKTGGPAPGPGSGAGPMGGMPPPAGAPAKPVAFLNVYTLKNAKAEEMLVVLKPLFQHAEMTADPRTNAVIVRADEKTLDEIKSLIARLESADAVKPK